MDPPVLVLTKMDRTIEIVIFLEGRRLLARANSSVSGGFAIALCETIRKLCSKKFWFRSVKKRNYAEMG
jgi:hypothetical protein